MWTPNHAIFHNSEVTDLENVMVLVHAYINLHQDLTFASYSQLRVKA